MGQKTHPYGFRLGVIKTWNTKWYEDKNYAQWLHEDMRIIARSVKKFAQREHRGIVDRARRQQGQGHRLHRASRHGHRQGRRRRRRNAAQGKSLAEVFTENEVFIDVQEVRKAETNAQLVAENIATQLERRVAFRRAMKKAVSTAMKFGAKGIRIRCSGRLGGGEMRRVETYREGRVPLHTLRADIEFGTAEARTTYGIIGVKAGSSRARFSQRRSAAADRGAAAAAAPS